jgi:hypothetical protein
LERRNAGPVGCIRSFGDVISPKSTPDRFSSPFLPKEAELPHAPRLRQDDLGRKERHPPAL